MVEVQAPSAPIDASGAHMSSYSMSPGHWGLWAFLVSEALLFGALVASALFLRLGGTVPWPRTGDVFDLGIATLATFVLIASSACAAEAEGAERRGHPAMVRRWLALTLALGALFLLFQAYEWRSVILRARFLLPVEGVPLIQNPWGAATFMQSFFLATGLHALHVAGGLVLLGFALRAHTGGGAAAGSFIRNVSLYWHFVDLIWIFLFAMFYLL